MCTSKIWDVLLVCSQAKIIRKVIFVMTVACFFIISGGFVNEAKAVKVCYCHGAEKNVHTICTSDTAEQNGHLFGHDDTPFGCECGDGVCDPTLEEDCSTCPQDCGPCETCGDGKIQEGEECGESGLDQCDPDYGFCDGCRCGNTCGDGVVDPGEACDEGGDTACCQNCQIVDSDGDGVGDCVDGCPSDNSKTEPGVCGCGLSDADLDGDGAADCVDECPESEIKSSPGICGCDTPDTDTDDDGVPNCIDNCPSDPLKTEPDVDTDGDGIPDSCLDVQPVLVNYAGGTNCSLSQYSQLTNAPISGFSIFLIILGGILCIRLFKLSKN